MMKATAVAKDCWILGQLAGIRMLEDELTGALKTPGAKAGEDVRQRVAELNAWLNRVDRVLTAREATDRRSTGSTRRRCLA